ncbi:MAG: glutathione S-transferase family protein [Pseudohongiellaceae bacterium]
MIEVYTANTPNGIKIPIALEELGLEYKLILLNLGKRDQKSDAFLEINPNGRIPAIIDHDVLNQQGKPLSIFESGAILLHLAEKAKNLLGKSVQDKTAALEWLFFQMGGVGPMFGQINYFRGSEKYPSENAVARFVEESNRLLSVLESRLSSVTWLAGEYYTIADIANYGWLRYAETTGLALEAYPAVQRWLERVERRPAIRRGLARVDSPDILFESSLASLAVQA